MEGVRQVVGILIPTTKKEDIMNLTTAKDVLQANGYELHKSYVHKPRYENEGKYMIVDVQHKACIAGERYQLTFEDVCEWIRECL